MAPAASLLPATSVAAASKRPAASDAEPLDSSSLPPQGGDQDAAPKNQQQLQQLECPRCGSTNTKFCYYNNYSTAQPRHLCRACRRYWTKGGTLRDVPVGGASRRGGNKRRRVSAEPSSASSPPPTPARAEDAYLDLPIFPFLSDGIFLPQFDLGVNVAPAAFSWPSAVPNYFYDGLAPWDDETRGVAVTGAWDNFADIVGLSWPPPDGN